jgi:hypothetical protein
MSGSGWPCTLAHECAHVEIAGAFESAFPGVLLRQKYADAHECFRWQIIVACWDEYAATSISARFGYDPTDGYEEVFLESLKETRNKANGLIKDYRLHGNVNQILAEVYGTYGVLMKFACYHLGNIAGRDRPLEDLPKTTAALNGHWFAPYVGRISEACKDIASDFGQWTDYAQFQVLGDLADEIVRDGGLFVSHREDGTLQVDIPLTAETMPEPA